MVQKAIDYFNMMRNWNFWLRLLAFGAVVVVPYYVVKKNWLEANEPQYKLVSVQDADTWFIGVSTMRAGLSPEHFVRELGGARKGFNLAINGGITPHGPCLTSFLKKKFKRKTGDGKRNLFVVEWRASSFNTKIKNLLNTVHEEDEILYQMNLVNANPNFEFILRRMHHIRSLMLDLLLRSKSRENMVIHKTGWAARRVPDVFPTQEEIEKKSFNFEKKKRNVFSPMRMASFFELIDHLTACGDVIVLATPLSEVSRRAPVADEFISAENFLRARKDVLFLDYSDWAERTDFADYNHLHQEAAIRLSSDVGKKVRDLLGETM